MREIKFRGFNTKHGWVHGDLHLMSANPHIHTSPSGRCPIIPHTVGQFTGLLDKNGKYIYEGDILRIKVYHNEGQGETFDFREEFDVNDLKGPLWRYYISAVSFDDCGFCVSEDSENDTGLGCFCGDMRHSFPIFEAEIIGNIHDNPELING